MATWLAPALGVVTLAVAVAIGGVVLTQPADGSTCDRAAVASVLRDGIAQADTRGRAQVDVVAPEHCTDADLEGTLPGITREWHFMPGGILMREPSHAVPAP